MRIAIVALIWFVASAAHAETIYKCAGKNGVVEYSQSPCQSSTIKVISPEAAPSEADRRRAQARVTAEAQRYRDQEEAAARLREAKRAENMRLFAPAQAAQPVDSNIAEKRPVGTKEASERKTQNQTDRAAVAAAAARAKAPKSCAVSMVTAGVGSEYCPP